MKNWKVVKKVSGNDTYYYIYRRKFLFFWTYMYSETPEEWDRHFNNMKEGGVDIDKSIMLVNF